MQRYLSEGKIPAPPVETMQGWKFRVWTDEDIEAVRKLLPKIANGRKTRYQKLREQKGAQPRAAALRKTKKQKKKQP